MDGWYLIGVYAIILIIQIVMLIKLFKNKKSFGKLYLFEVLSILLALGIGYYFDEVVDKFSGLAFFGEFMFSLVAMFVFGGMLILTIVLESIMKLLKSKKK